MTVKKTSYFIIVVVIILFAKSKDNSTRGVNSGGRTARQYTLTVTVALKQNKFNEVQKYIVFIYTRLTDDFVNKFFYITHDAYFDEIQQ